MIKPEICPACGAILVETGANLFCPNEKCRPRVIANIANFASKNGVNIDGFSEMTAALLLDKFGVDTFSGLYKLGKDELLKLEGFKDAKTENLIGAIENSKKVPLSNFIFALGIDNVGKKTAKDLANEYRNIENLKNATVEELANLSDFGEITAKCVYDFMHDEKNIKEIDELLSLGVSPYFEETVKSGAFSGEKVVLTGTLSDFKRDEAAKIIEENGGEIMSSVSKNTTLVLAGESAGSKLDKAKKLGIKIIDQETFVKMIK